MLREIRQMLDGQETRSKQDRFQEQVQSWVENSQGTSGEFMDRELKILRVLSVHKKL